MGNCCSGSFQTTDVATAKVVVHDGRMQEFSYPVKVSYLLQLYPACFICDSDEMRFDDVISAVHENEELQLGQLYFALPLNRLKRPLLPEEMAALAVTANSAFKTIAVAGGKCGFGRKQILFAPGDGNAKPSRRVVPDVGCGDDSVGYRSRRGRGRGSGGKFKAMLSSIPE
ncbi:hypothetical protein RJT34_30633 [Clitoria ternatea]|uniref:Uncharacterized protein n=1 Tax=Clitoria ternatea TaxID=43366 RepID=A0AAN9I2T9_CLITE